MCVAEDELKKLRKWSVATLIRMRKNVVGFVSIESWAKQFDVKDPVLVEMLVKHAEDDVGKCDRCGNTSPLKVITSSHRRGHVLREQVCAYDDGC